MQKQVSTIAGIIIIIAVAVLAFGGIWLYLQKSQTSVINVQPNPSVQNSSTQIADWKTYSNAKYSFEVKYPTILSPEVYDENGLYSVVFHSANGKDNIDGFFQIVVISESSISHYYSCDIASLLSTKQIGYDCSNDCTSNFESPPVCEKIQSINDYKAIKFEEIGGGFHYLLKNNNQYFKISYYAPGSFSQVASEQMLSTFKFTK